MVVGEKGKGNRWLIGSKERWGAKKKGFTQHDKYSTIIAFVKQNEVSILLILITSGANSLQMQ